VVNQTLFGCRGSTLKWYTRGARSGKGSSRLSVSIVEAKSCSRGVVACLRSKEGIRQLITTIQLVDHDGLHGGRKVLREGGGGGV
jgi:hypothetical protein